MRVVSCIALTIWLFTPAPPVVAGTVDVDAAARVAGTVRVDANTATEAQLQAVKGIGPGIARRIVEERRRAGPFADLADLQRRVRGVGPANLRRMRAAGLEAGGRLGGVPPAGVRMPRAAAAPGPTAGAGR